MNQWLPYEDSCINCQRPERRRRYNVVAVDPVRTANPTFVRGISAPMVFPIDRVFFDRRARRGLRCAAPAFRIASGHATFENMRQRRGTCGTERRIASERWPLARHGGCLGRRRRVIQKLMMPHHLRQPIAFVSAVDPGRDSQFSIGDGGADAAAAHDQAAQGHRRDCVLEAEGKLAHQLYSLATGRFIVELGAWGR
jgi:hypothetical protein